MKFPQPESSSAAIMPAATSHPVSLVRCSNIKVSGFMAGDSADATAAGNLSMGTLTPTRWLGSLLREETAAVGGALRPDGLGFGKSCRGIKPLPHGIQDTPLGDHRYTDAYPDATIAAGPDIGAAAIPRIIEPGIGSLIVVALAQRDEVSRVHGIVAPAASGKGQRHQKEEPAERLGFHLAPSFPAFAGTLTTPMAPPRGSVMIASCIAPGRSRGATST